MSDIFAKTSHGMTDFINDGTDIEIANAGDYEINCPIFSMQSIRLSIGLYFTIQWWDDFQSNMPWFHFKLRNN